MIVEKEDITIAPESWEDVLLEPALEPPEEYTPPTSWIDIIKKLIPSFNGNGDESVYPVDSMTNDEIIHYYLDKLIAKYAITPQGSDFFTSIAETAKELCTDQNDIYNSTKGLIVKGLILKTDIPAFIDAKGTTKEKLWLKYVDVRTFFLGWKGKLVLGGVIILVGLVGGYIFINYIKIYGQEKAKAKVQEKIKKKEEKKNA